MSEQMPATPSNGAAVPAAGSPGRSPSHARAVPAAPGALAAGGVSVARGARGHAVERVRITIPDGSLMSTVHHHSAPVGGLKVVVRIIRERRADVG